MGGRIERVVERGRDAEWRGLYRVGGSKSGEGCREVVEGGGGRRVERL